MRRVSASRRKAGRPPPRSTYSNPVADMFPLEPVATLSSSSSSSSLLPSSWSSFWLSSVDIPSSSSSPRTEALRTELRQIDRLFNLYANSYNVMDPEGIEELCRHLEVEHTDVKILMLSWKMKAEKQGFFSRDEWRRGLRRMKANNMMKFKNALFELEEEARAPSNFEDFFSYSFRYCLTDERQRCLDIETVCQLLDLVMGPRYRPQVDLLIEFLKAQTEYRALGMDQWINIFRFCEEISFPDLQNYNPDEAWPVILDRFVEWLREKQA